MRKQDKYILVVLFFILGVLSYSFEKKIYIYDLGKMYETGYFPFAGKILGSFSITEKGIVNIKEEKAENKINDLILGYKKELFNNLFENFSVEEKIRNKDLIIWSYKNFFSDNLKILLDEDENKHLLKKKSHNERINYLNKKYDEINLKNEKKIVLKTPFEKDGNQNRKNYIYKIFDDGNILGNFGEIYFDTRGNVEKEKIYKLSPSNPMLLEEKNIYTEYKNIPNIEKIKNCYFNFFNANSKEKYKLNIISYKTYLFFEKNFLLLDEEEKKELEQIKDNKTEVENFLNKRKIFYLTRKINCSRIWEKMNY